MRKTIKIIVIFWAILAALRLSSPLAEAAKKRVRVTPIKGVAYSSAKLSRPTNSIVLSLLNLGKVSKISYTLSYTANGIDQGVVGSLIPTDQTTDSRDLYFGTCSKGVCTPHHNITNATLTVSVTLKSGGVYTKRYIIRI
ncbi:MAG: hypothetical protein UV61_C0016G0008 [Candidatus Gottesmanbacteria bacterium GW2011_GWB1_43_11]|uniref:Uncharacterized protein n=1 Tax=Candidatus Gottesmanbacteria bacterium GW2011_GWB1_43_11 TaxID=1618446 RepID=A0A0G1ERF5_9BACT|nr:MAG: hypothetical protein UV04_C0006G0044 [Candidatus Gottesmanbacteria bacterium GW2011_GWA2_42_16]KKS53000.1 MAG: hypothetical protein UV17_C0041G0009 [Candidatus Gottesmanbacteria bacterium GW2011_GWA1_42_26]KKS80839.1 MAG: hypothetical protein UV55_C0028G0012 [Candidatus Gottesmanbacteria bacterium GW2011_GWC1_43_10]KKS85636.1 MAG: hypothetical protein UV61_C0016G0008 [Candidatus Gottesmanbacteria bacterium GW2011_GWB1_43_11]OGG10648.1 MAG: hypothetical protein A2699_00275 [Candidatus Go